MESLVWLGYERPYLDKIEIRNLNHVTLGLYGGYKSKETGKNEDACLVLTHDQDVMAFIWDAHTSYDSIAQMIQAFSKDILNKIFKMDLKDSFKAFHNYMMAWLSREETKHLKGETAFLAVYERQGYLNWFSVGDNSLYLFHEETMSLSQYRLNQRIFYQWYGKSNSLDLDVPCYQSGTVELRQGKSHILLMTDGVLEIETAPYEKPNKLYQDLLEGPTVILETVKHLKGHDNASLLTWETNKESVSLRPTRSQT